MFRNYFTSILHVKVKQNMRKRANDEKLQKEKVLFISNSYFG